MPFFPLKNAVMIAWKRECFRSTSTASLFGAELCLVAAGSGKSLRGKALGYMRSAVETVNMLVRKRPDTVICLNQPPMLPIICGLYSFMTGAAVIMDFHSGALSKRQWKIFLPMLRSVARRSPFTICHNRQDGREILSWGAEVINIFSIPRNGLDGITYQPRSGRPFFLFSCSFAEDEPVDLAIEAMKACPEFDFLISGDYRKYSLVPADMPKHIKLAGFMSYADYLSAMGRSVAVISLSTRPHIMQMAVEEALSAGIPVMTNTSETLSEVLGEGATFSDLRASDLARALRDVVTNYDIRITGIQRAKQDVYAHISNELIRTKALHPEIFA